MMIRYDQPVRGHASLVSSDAVHNYRAAARSRSDPRRWCIRARHPRGSARVRNVGGFPSPAMSELPTRSNAPSLIQFVLGTGRGIVRKRRAPG